MEQKYGGIRDVSGSYEPGRIAHFVIMSRPLCSISDSQEGDRWEPQIEPTPSFHEEFIPARLKWWQLNIVQRTLSAIFLAPVVTIFIWKSPAFATSTFCSFLTSICSYEYAWLAHRIRCRVLRRVYAWESHQQTEQGTCQHTWIHSSPTECCCVVDEDERELQTTGYKPQHAVFHRLRVFCPRQVDPMLWQWILPIILALFLSILTSLLFLNIIMPLIPQLKETELYHYRILFTTTTNLIAAYCAIKTPTFQSAVILWIHHIVFLILTMFSTVCPINQLGCGDGIEPSKICLSAIGFILFFHIMTSRQGIEAWFSIGLDVLGFIYIIGTLSNVISFVDDDKRGLYRELLIVVLYVTWASDTGAYFTGKILSRIGYHKYHPLASHLSKNKDYEGTIGAIVCGIGAMAITSYLLQVDGSFFTKMVFTIFAVIVGRCGDLFVSLLKRSACVKDSGSLIPGHGGCLDRIDALLFAALVFSKYYSLAIKSTTSQDAVYSH